MFSKIKTSARALRRHGMSVAATVGSGSLMLAQTAHAALPAGVSDGFTAFETDATTLAGYAGAAMMVILGLTVGLKLTKRFANKL